MPDGGPGAPDADGGGPRDVFGGGDARDAAPVGDHDAQPNYMFVTSMTYPPKFSSATEADDRCNVASAAGGLPGRYRAWLSTAAESAIDRIAGARGWVRPDGAPFADSRADIAAGRIYYPPLIDEYAHELRGDGARVMTGSDPSGGKDAGGTCANWTSSDGAGVGGRTEWTGNEWTSYLSFDCSEPMHLYCFGMDVAAPLPAPVPATGKLAFITRDVFKLGAGIEAADALCAAEAAVVALPQRFKALLGTSAAAASSRFPSSGDTTWIRADGIPISVPTGERLGSQPLIAPLNVTARKEYVGNAALFVGPDVGDPGGAVNTCNEWRDPLSAAEVTIAHASSSARWFGGDRQPCNLLAAYGHLICLED